jgi:hypothetical protein
VPVAPFDLGKVSPDSAVGMALIARTDPFITVGRGDDPFLGKNVRATVHQEDGMTTTLFHSPNRKRRRTSCPILAS